LGTRDGEKDNFAEEVLRFLRGAPHFRVMERDCGQ